MDFGSVPGNFQIIKPPCSMFRNLIFILFTVTFIFSNPLYAQDSAAIKYGYNSVAGDYLEVAKDTRLYYEIYGSGEPVLMLHGGVFGYIDEFSGIIQKLSKTNKVICLATRGHVKSDIGHEPFTFDQRANDAKKLLDHLNIRSVDVIGFSDGGFTAYKLAARFPDLIKKAVVIGAADRPKNSRPPVNYTADTLLHHAGDYFRPRITAMREPERWNESLQMLSNLYNTQVVSVETFSKIKSPVLLIAGEEDEYHKPALMESAHKAIKQSKLLIVPGCGHVVFHCKFDLVWNEIEKFLKGSSALP